MIPDFHCTRVNYHAYTTTKVNRENYNIILYKRHSCAYSFALLSESILASHLYHLILHECKDSMVMVI